MTVEARRLDRGDEREKALRTGIVEYNVCESGGKEYRGGDV